MEKKTRSMVWKVLLAVIVVSVVGIGTALVQENKSSDIDSAPDAEFNWTAPTTGTPVHHYIAQMLVNERDTLFFDSVMSESITVSVVYGNKYRIRVAAVDASDIQGPMSIWSVPYTPELAPPGF
jgi:hypothetical protein